MKEVFDDNFGGEFGNVNIARPGYKPLKRFTNAYMLVYIRASDLENIVHPIESKDIPSHLIRRFEDDKAVQEARRKEKEEQHLFYTVKVRDIKLLPGNRSVLLSYILPDRHK